VYAVYDLEFDYLHLNQVMKMVKDFDAEIFDQQFEMICRMKIKIRGGNTNALLAKLNIIDHLKINDIESE
jgi:putative IMPACT (imprinted ancient) family translation regulator